MTLRLHPALAGLAVLMIVAAAACTPPPEGGGQPCSPPGVPSTVDVEPGDQQITVSWSEPGDLGGCPLTSFVVVVGTAETTVDPATFSTMVGGLANGTEYPVSVFATNQAGSGPASHVVQATPSGLPGVVATPSVSSPSPLQLSASWVAPSGNGSAVLDYEVDINPGGSATTAGLSWTFSGLNQNTTYGIRVRARNANGYGPWSGYASRTPDEVYWTIGVLSNVQGGVVNVRADTTPASTTYGTYPANGSVRVVCWVTGTDIYPWTGFHNIHWYRLPRNWGHGYTADSTRWVTDSALATLNLQTPDPRVPAC